jgi:hypothetical protein
MASGHEGGRCSPDRDYPMSTHGTFRKSRDVRVESEMGRITDGGGWPPAIPIDQHLP